MAHVQRLPLYSAAYVYLREICRVRMKLPKFLKYDLGQEAFSSAIKIIKWIVVANRSSKKEDFIQELLLEIEVQWTILRMLFDFRGITEGEFRVLSERLSNIGHQAKAWLQWQKTAQFESRTSKTNKKDIGKQDGMPYP